MSKFIKFGFKTIGFKNTWKTTSPNIAHMRRRNLHFSKLEAKRYRVDVKQFDNRSYFHKKNNSNSLVIWFHGGAYSLGPFKWHLMRFNEICDALGVDGVMPDYPKTPEFTYKENLEYLLDYYKEVISKYDSFYFIGDSAGGGLALSFSLLLKNKGYSGPTCIFALSPWLDLSSSIDCSQYEHLDPFLSQVGLNVFANFYANKALSSQYVSPFFGDFSKVDSQIYVYSGTHDILHGVIVEFFKKNPNIHQRIFDEMIHVWPLMPIPESKVVINEIIELIQKDLALSSQYQSA